MKTKIITLCGPMRFRDKYLEEYRRLVAEGNIVLVNTLFANEDVTTLDENDISYHAMHHLDYIDMSDTIFVVNVGGYYGESTTREINYATNRKKEIIFLEEV